MGKLLKDYFWLLAGVFVLYALAGPKQQLSRTIYCRRPDGSVYPTTTGCSGNDIPMDTPNG